jgi:D-glycero-D-manno-heptose 1,7-bisphosphate phosphatase
VGRSRAHPVRALLCDRDGTLIEDVPYNAEAAAVRPLPGVADALARVRAAGWRVGVVTNQSGLSRGRIRPEQLEAVHARLVELLGPFDVIAVCPHGPADGCSCRKPEPGLVVRAAAALDVPPAACVVVGDRRCDVVAAKRAGAMALLVGGSNGSFADRVDSVLERS